jgi:hypothetical protein
MNGLLDVLRSVLTHPTPESLVALQGQLLMSAGPEEAVTAALEVADRFHAYLSELQSKVAALDYSELASRLDIGAVGVVALENVVDAEQSKFWEHLVLGGLAEGLMVGASRQYIKGWELEAGLVHSRAAWYLAEALWHASAKTQAELSPQQRWEAIEALLAPAYSSDVPGSTKAVLLGRIFQMLLLTHLVPLLIAPETGAV